MKFCLKTIFTALIFTSFYTTSFAQPASGIKVGANYTLYKDNDITNFSPKIGYQFGYAWRIKINELFALSLEGMLTQKSSNVQTNIEEMGIYLDDNRKANYLSAPIGINYCFKNAYIGAGYEFGYLVSGDLPVNTYDHALFLQAAYKIRYFDIALKYAGTINKEPGGTIVYTGSTNQYYTPKANTLQLSLIFNLGKK
jgi:hypothetical protein